MKKSILLSIVVFLTLTSLKSDKPAYQFFSLKGKKADYKDLLKSALESDIIFFGELHNSPVCHWLQLELTRDLYAEKGDKLVMGAEMFEADDQLLLDEYLSGKIRERNFEEEAKLWNNYKTDYKPLLLFALDKKIPFIGTNVPRRYAAVVNKEGFEGLDELGEEAKKFIAPSPILYDPDLKGYKGMIEMMGGAGGHVTPNIPKAQALKDATMAYFILENWQPGKTFIHYNGTYHSNNFEGIIWYIRQARPDLNLLTIATVEQDSIKNLEEDNMQLADYTLCIPSAMTKTY